ncbi:Sodium:solute symporter family protein [Planctomycetales bacterium 10988]|nr:Sodium:solute symporter family protein [Planctomycetales bacterium 10988]
MMLAQVSVSTGIIPIAVIAGYLLLLLFLGWLGHHRSVAGEEDYYLAGRGQGWMISTLTIMATFLSSFALLGAPGMVYREGVVFALVSLNVPIAGFCIYLLGKRIWQAGRDGGYVTQADMICDHYQSPVALRLLVTLVGFLFVVPYVMMQIKAGGDLANVLFPGGEYTFEIGAILLALVTAAYIMVGGMRSVAWTDAIQCVLLLAGMLLAGLAMIVSFGGPQAFSEGIAEIPESSLTLPGNTGVWTIPFLFSVCLLMPIGGIIQPAQWMRFYSASGPSALRRSALLFILVLTGCFLFGIMPVGLGGQALYPLEISEAGVSPAEEVGSFDQILVLVAHKNMPVLFGETAGALISTLLVVAIMAASMSTADSNLHALSALLTRDLYSHFFRPQAKEAERVWIGRFFILFATTVALVCVLVGRQPESSFASFMEMIVDLALFAVAFSVQLLPITIDILYLKRGTKWGAILGLTTGLLSAFCFTSLFSLAIGQVPEGSFAASFSDWIASAKAFLPMHAAAWGLIPNFLVFSGISLIQRLLQANND